MQRLGGLLHGVDRSEHLREVLFQHLAPCGRGTFPFAAKLGESLHLPDGHPGFAQAQQESDPVQVRGRVAALAAGRAGDGHDQPGTLVVAQGVCRQAGAFGNFGNGQEGCHGKDFQSSSALEVKPFHLAMSTANHRLGRLPEVPGEGRAEAGRVALLVVCRAGGGGYRIGGGALGRWARRWPVPVPGARAARPPVLRCLPAPGGVRRRWPGERRTGLFFHGR